MPSSINDAATRYRKALSLMDSETVDPGLLSDSEQLIADASFIEALIESECSDFVNNSSSKSQRQQILLSEPYIHARAWTRHALISAVYLNEHDAFDPFDDLAKLLGDIPRTLYAILTASGPKNVATWGEAIFSTVKSALSEVDLKASSQSTILVNILEMLGKLDYLSTHLPEHTIAWMEQGALEFDEARAIECFLSLLRRNRTALLERGRSVNVLPASLALTSTIESVDELFERNYTSGELPRPSVFGLYEDLCRELEADAIRGAYVRLPISSRWINDLFELLIREEDVTIVSNNGICCANPEAVELSKLMMSFGP